MISLSNLDEIAPSSPTSSYFRCSKIGSPNTSPQPSLLECHRQAAKFYSRCPIHKNPSRWPSRCLLVLETGAMSWSMSWIPAPIWRNSSCRFFISRRGPLLGRPAPVWRNESSAHITSFKTSKAQRTWEKDSCLQKRDLCHPPNHQHES